MDFVYLWGGKTLPDGMSYAEYAHRGAYPLIATALLAGAFVLVALRPGSETESDSIDPVSCLLLDRTKYFPGHFFDLENRHYISKNIHSLICAWRL